MTNFEELPKKKQHDFIKSSLIHTDTWTYNEKVRGVVDCIYSQFHSQISRNDLEKIIGNCMISRSNEDKYNKRIRV